VRWEGMAQSDEIGAADWIRDRLRGFAADVGSVIPHGFDAYARIFHPAWTWAPRDTQGTEVRWSAVAAASGRTVHPEMQFNSIAAPMPGRENARLMWSGEPRLGVLSGRQAGALIPLLATHTLTPDRCWFCLWEGYGYLTGGTAVTYFWPVGEPKPPPEHLRPPQPKLSKSRVRLPHRDYVLFTGSVTDADGWEDGPNLWWPDDRAWCVASEIDFPYSYVGGSAALIEEILADPHLEAQPATVHDRITADSDIVNS
jgi:hypothetical protein